MRLQQYMHGITMMELMIVVAIAGILSAIALPNYNDFVSRAKRNEARAALLQIATNQEKLYLQNSQYTVDLIALGFPADPFTTDSGSYDISVSPGPDNNLFASYMATATFILDGGERNKCATMTIDATGEKTSAPDSNCWNRTR